MPDDYFDWRNDVQQIHDPTLSLVAVAVGFGQLEYLKLLLRHGYQVPSLVDNILLKYTRAFENEIFLSDAGLEIIQTLHRHGANINDPPARDGGVTALQVASIKGYYGLVKRLLDLQANPNAPGAAIFGRTALEGAAEYGRLDVVQLLLNSGVETCGSGRRQCVRAIEFARKEGHPILVKLLSSHRPWTEADQELLKDETLLNPDQTPEGIAERRGEVEGHVSQATDDDETGGYETSECSDSDYDGSDDEISEDKISEDETSKDDAEEASLNRLPASTLEETSNQGGSTDR
ncbi:Protein fem-1-like protein B [Colletotrichum shisoi]|uniref:Protein fem-1-like protein B n=1 Tax=Colletotrichum shisoi TaxID=2078593 RepID=A0A5Q4BXN4_9PEZI|nr:Protein fem-1-like protein B [Colletotrichum shisoi]